MEEQSLLSLTIILLFFLSYNIRKCYYEKKPSTFISFKLHFVISDKYDNKEQWQKIEIIFLTLSTAHSDILGNVFKEI